MRKLFQLGFLLLSLNVSGQFTFDLIPFKNNDDGPWGFKDFDENIVVEPIYEFVTHFYNGFSLVKTKKGYNFVDSNGKRLLLKDVDFVSPFNPNYSIISEDDKEKLIDRNGKVIDELLLLDNPSHTSEFRTQGDFYKIGEKIKHVNKGEIHRKFNGKKIVFLNCSKDSDLKILSVVYEHQNLKKLVIVDPFQDENILEKPNLFYLSNYDYLNFLLVENKLLVENRDRTLKQTGFYTLNHNGEYVCCKFEEGSKFLDNFIGERERIIYHPTLLISKVKGIFDMITLNKFKPNDDRKIVVTKFPKSISLLQNKDSVHLIINDNIKEGSFFETTNEKLKLRHYGIDQFSVGPKFKSIFEYQTYWGNPPLSSNHHISYTKNYDVNTIILESISGFYLYDFSPSYLLEIGDRGYNDKDVSEVGKDIIIDGVYPQFIDDNNPFINLDKNLYDK